MQPVLPPNTHHFFWDVSPLDINTAQDYFYIIERILEYGDDPAIKWLISCYSDEKIREVIKNSRNISRKTALLWQNFYNMPREEIKCLNRSYPKTGGIFWNY